MPEQNKSCETCQHYASNDHGGDYCELPTCDFRPYQTKPATSTVLLVFSRYNTLQELAEAQDAHTRHEIAKDLRQFIMDYRVEFQCIPETLESLKGLTLTLEEESCQKK